MIYRCGHKKGKSQKISDSLCPDCRRREDEAKYECGWTGTLTETISKGGSK